MGSLEIAISILKPIAELGTGWLKEEDRKSLLLRLLYLELVDNVELFAAANEFRGEIRNLPTTDPRFVWIVANLKTEAIDALLLGDEASFQSIVQIDSLAKDAFVEEDDSIVKPLRWPPDNAAQALKYVAKQIRFLKAFCADPAVVALSGVKAGLRLERVKILMVALIGPLSKFEGLKVLSR